MLDQLLHLKQFREDAAERGVAGRRSALASASRSSEQADAALRSYQQWSAQREQAMYAALCQKVVLPRELQWAREDVAALRESEREKQDEQVRAQSERERAEQALELSLRQHQAAIRVREKFVALVDAAVAEQRAEAERAEDAEIDDVLSAARERVQWEQGDDD